SRVDRWRRVAVSAAKQCGRSVVPEVLEAAPLDEAIPALPRPLIVLAEPSSAASPAPLPPAPAAATVVVGPEGGWTPAEIEALAAAGATFFQVGGRTLRADAAPLVALAVLL